MDQFNQILNSAKLAFLDKDYHFAIEKFNAALQIKPDDAWALTCRSEIKLIIKDYQGAEADATFAIKKGHTDAKLLHLRALARIELKKFYEARFDLENSIKLTANPSVQKKLDDLNIEYKEEIEKQKHACIQNMSDEFEKCENEKKDNRNKQFDYKFLLLHKSFLVPEITKDVLIEIDSKFEELLPEAFILKRTDFFTLRAYLYESLSILSDDDINMKLAFSEKALANYTILLDISGENSDMSEKLTKLISENTIANFKLHANLQKSNKKPEEVYLFTDQEREEIDKKKTIIRGKLGIK